jgi:hypothetical protein
MKMSDADEAKRLSNSSRESVSALREVFNYAVVAHAVATADELRIFQTISTNGSFKISTGDDHSAISKPGVTAVLDLLEASGMVRRSGIDTYVRGPNFADALELKGFFTWLFSGSGTMLTRAASFLGEEGSPSDMVGHRNERLISSACADFGQYELDPTILALPVWLSAHHVADLGCGDASRAIELVQRYPIRATGLDISENVIAQAAENVIAHGLTARVTLKLHDVRDIPPHVSFEADVLLTCLMGHDLWPREECITTLINWRTAFPRARTLVLCDTVKAPSGDILSEEIPSVGFEYLHAIMGQYIPSSEEWRAVLASAGWPVSQTLSIEIPANTFVFVCQRSNI